MKKIIIGFLALVSISAFADNIHLKIDRQFWGENSYGHIDGQSYNIYCQDKIYGSVIFENPHDSNGRALQEYQLSDEDCFKALKNVDTAVKNYHEMFLSLNCKIAGTASFDCKLNL